MSLFCLCFIYNPMYDIPMLRHQPPPSRDMFLDVDHALARSTSRRDGNGRIRGGGCLLWV